MVDLESYNKWLQSKIYYYPELETKIEIMIENLEKGE